MFPEILESPEAAKFGGRIHTVGTGFIVSSAKSTLDSVESGPKLYS